jgi:hypothetical protein
MQTLALAAAAYIFVTSALAYYAYRARPASIA